MQDNIRKLEEIMPKLNESPTGALPLQTFILEGGEECPVWTLFKDGEDVGVAQAYMPKGGVFLEHKHGEFEVLVPYRGAMEWEGKEYGVGSVLYIHPGTPHRIVAKEDCWVIAINVPLSKWISHER